MLEPAREGRLKLLKHIGEVLIGVGETDRPLCPIPSATSLISLAEIAENAERL